MGCMITTSTAAIRGHGQGSIKEGYGDMGWIRWCGFVGLGGYVSQGKFLLRATAYGYLHNISHLLSFHGLLFL